MNKTDVVAERGCGREEKELEASNRLAERERSVHSPALSVVSVGTPGLL